MKTLHNGLCLSIKTIIFTIEFMLTNVRGNELESNEEPDATYAWIGAGIGLFFAICFIGSKLYMIKKHMLDNEVSEDSVKRPSLRTTLVDMKD
ncbi:unnamed protein product [Oncorhynchus mykiss]|uniref:Uncharacterized protein n=1 Tax=Oncorhynchus mykiss TaxID=8022 RepID=A0A060WHP0_ONCMY|nr:unnamed protein product [Oncorhynchus mykiss]